MTHRNRLAVTFGTMAVVLAVTIFLMYLVGNFVLKKDQEIMRRQAAAAHLRQVLSTLADAETGQRGYLLTGDESYLQPYHEALGRIHNELSALQGMPRWDDLRPEDVAEVNDLTARKLAELDRTIALRRTGSLGDAVSVVHSGEGKEYMEALRSRIGGLIDAQQSAADAGRLTSRRATTARTIVFATVGLGDIAFLGWAWRRVLNEMTSREEWAAETRRQKDLLGVTLASIGDAVIVTDNKARVTFMNVVAEALTGWASADASGEPLANVFRIVNEQTRQPVESPVDKVLRAGAVVGLANHTLLIRPDGSEIPIDDSGAPIRDPDGNVHGVVLVFRDFTDYKESERKLTQAKSDAEAARVIAEQALASAETAQASAETARAAAETARAAAETARADAETARADAETANRAKDHFLAALSHELRTPLTPVLATLTAWEHAGDLPDLYRAEVPLLRRNVELEARLIDDLLDLHRIARGKLSLHLEVVDLHDLLEAVLGICQSEANAKRLDVMLRLEAKHHHVRADSARVQQVFWNILRNAAKFTPAHGRIEITTSDEPHGVGILDGDGIPGSATPRDMDMSSGSADARSRIGSSGVDESFGGRIRVAVADTGIGMNAEALARLFRPFEQGADDIARRFGGLGLGMALSKALLDVQGGTIDASSDGPGKGATFTVSLPAVAVPQAGDRPPMPAPEAPARALDILLVEDHEDTARTMAILLKRHGHRVAIADSVTAALSHAGNVDLLLSDIGLPDGTGIDLIGAFRQRSAAPAIALTGFGMEEDIAKCINAGFTAHMTKPVNFQKLTAMIQELAAKRSAGEAT